MSNLPMVHTSTRIDKAVCRSHDALKEHSFVGRDLTDIASQLLDDFEQSDDLGALPSQRVNTVREALYHMKRHQDVQIASAGSNTIRLTLEEQPPKP